VADLRRGQLVTSRRGSAGGYRLARPAESISLGDVFRAVDDPLGQRRQVRLQETAYRGACTNLTIVWAAVQESLGRVLNRTSLANILDGQVPLPTAVLGARLRRGFAFGRRGTSSGHE
jgi:Rrf2 family protein